MQTKNYYQILGVEPRSTSFEIKSAYRKLALQFHPDKNADDITAEQVFKEINEAYNILSDQQKRADYHQKYFGNNVLRKQEKAEQISSVFVYEKVRIINKNLEHADPYRMNTDALMYQLQQLFSSLHIAILQKENNVIKNNAIIDEMFAILKFLPIDEQRIIIEDLRKIPSDRAVKIDSFLEKQQTISFLEMYKLLLIFCAAIVICILLYFLIR